MEELNLTPNEMLELHDDPVNWEYPRGFDYDAEQERFMDFAGAFRAALQLDAKTETGICIQDASFHSQLIFAVDDGRSPSHRTRPFARCSLSTPAMIN